MFCPIFILQKEPVVPFLMLSAKQGNYWYHFVTSLVWRCPLSGIEPGTSGTHSQHSTTRLSRRRYHMLVSTNYYLKVPVYTLMIIWLFLVYSFNFSTLIISCSNTNNNWSIHTHGRQIITLQEYIIYKLNGYQYETKWWNVTGYLVDRYDNHECTSADFNIYRNTHVSQFWLSKHYYCIFTFILAWQKAHKNATASLTSVNALNYSTA